MQPAVRVNIRADLVRYDMVLLSCVGDETKDADVSVANTPSIPWITADDPSNAPGATQYFSADTPIGAPSAEACGRVVYSDLHVGAASGDYSFDGTHVPDAAVVPDGCVDAELSAQEDALEFMLFDLSACIEPPEQSPGLPVIE